MRLRLRMRSGEGAAGGMDVFWRTADDATQAAWWGTWRMVNYPLQHDWQWHEYTMPIPSSAGRVQIRFDPGDKPGRAEIDWVEVEEYTVPEAELAAGKRLPARVQIEDAVLKVIFSGTDKLLRIIDQRTGREWRGDCGKTQALLTDVKPDGERALRFRFHDPSTGAQYDSVASLSAPGVLSFTVESSQPELPFWALRQWPPRLQSDLKDGRVIFCDRSSGTMIEQTDKFYGVKPLRVWGNTQCMNMPWIGLFDFKRGDGLLQVIETPADALIWLQNEDGGRIWPQIEWQASMNTFRYGRKMFYQFVPGGGHVALARAYREYVQTQPRFKPLTQKIRERPNVARLAGAAFMWGSSDVEEFIAQARTEGVLRATLLNAQHGLKDDAGIRRLNKMGYLTGQYDSWGDFSEGPTGSHLGPVQKQAYHLQPGSGPKQGWVYPDGSSSYDRSSAFALEVLKSFVPANLKRFGYNAQFIDVHMAMELFEDWHPEHTFDRRQDLANRHAAYEYLVGQDLVIGTEHGNDWGVDVCDWFEGASGGPNFWLAQGPGWNAGSLRRAVTPGDYPQPYLDYGANRTRQIPLWQLVYQDCTVSTFYWGDGADYHFWARPDISDQKDLVNILYGSLPQLWRDKTGYDWEINRDRFMRTYHDTTHLQARLMLTQMVNHEFLSDDLLVQRTQFSNGTQVVVNFGEKPFDYKTTQGETITLAARGYLARGPQIRQERVVENGEVIKRLEYDDFRQYATEKRQRIGPVECDGVFTAFKVGPGRWQLVLDGRRDYRLDARALTGWGVSTAITLVELSPRGEAMEYLHPTREGDQIRFAPSGVERRYVALLADEPATMPLIYPHGGMVTTTRSLVLSHPDAAAEIRYTLDGSSVTVDARRYTQPLKINDATELRARAFLAGAPISLEARERMDTARLIWQTPIVRWNEPAVRVSLPLGGVRILRISVNSAGQNHWADWVNLGEMELIAADGTHTRLADLDPELISQTNRQFTKHKQPEGTPLRTKGRVFKHGLAVASVGEYRYALDRNYERLEGWVGIEDTSAPNQFLIEGAVVVGFEALDLLDKKGQALRIEVKPDRITNPVRRNPDLRPGTDLNHLALRARAPWMSEGIVLRLPEVLQSHRGVHFIDHFMPDLAPLNEPMPFPTWETDPHSGAIMYRCQLPEGVEFGARAVPGSDVVDLEFQVTNHTSDSLGNVHANPCLILGSCPELAHPQQLTKLMAVLDHRLMRLSETSPTPAQKKRGAWLLMLMRDAEAGWQGGNDSPTWWLLDQRADLNLMVSESQDGRHLLGYTWDHADQTMMSNCGHPCMHTGPGPLTELKAGRTVRWRGRIYFVANDPDALLARVKADHASWQAHPTDSGERDKF